MSPRTAAALLCCIALAGCAVGGGRLNLAADRRFELRVLDSVSKGMPEAEVVATLGLPVAFGIDDRGRRYLQYNLSSFGSSVFGAGTGVIGINAMMIQSTASGFEARIFIEGGRVNHVATQVYSVAAETRGDAAAMDLVGAGR